MKFRYFNTMASQFPSQKLLFLIIKKFEYHGSSIERIWFKNKKMRRWERAIQASHRKDDRFFIKRKYVLFSLNMAR